VVFGADLHLYTTKPAPMTMVVNVIF
jgi:hypothetical protein